MHPHRRGAAEKLCRRIWPHAPMTLRATGVGGRQQGFQPGQHPARLCGGKRGETGDEVAELCCNLDDMTGEAIGYAQELLLEAGALDVYTLPLQMKKGRPGVMLCCLCRPGDEGRMTDLLLKHTATWGCAPHASRALCSPAPRPRCRRPTEQCG